MNDNDKKRFMVMLDDLIRSVNEGDREEAVRLRQEIVRIVTPLEKLPEFIGNTERVEKIDKGAEITITEEVSIFAENLIVHSAIAHLGSTLVEEYLLYDKRPFQVRISQRTIERDAGKLHQFRFEIQDTVWHDYPLRNPADIERPVKQPD